MRWPEGTSESVVRPDPEGEDHIGKQRGRPFVCAGCSMPSQELTQKRQEPLVLVRLTGV